MNGRTAKAIRKSVYSEGADFRDRQYADLGKGILCVEKGQKVSRRRVYQLLKKKHVCQK